MKPVVLAGDIGGTKTVIASFEAGQEGQVTLSESSFPSSAHASLEEILGLFLAEQPEVEIAAACFGVAGAVIDGRSRITNLPWLLDEGDLARACASSSVVLLNDLEAAAYGMIGLGDSDRAVLNAGVESPGNIAVIAAGTGLGEALLVWDGQQHRAVASEGGHANFAPRNEEQIELLRFLRDEFGGHVSTEAI